VFSGLKNSLWPTYVYRSLNARHNVLYDTFLEGSF